MKAIQQGYKEDYTVENPQLIIDDKTGFPLLVSKRELVQRYNLPVSKIYKFYEGLAKGVLFATRCRKCGRFYFPPKADCDSCMSSSMSYVKLSGKAELLAYSTIYIKPASFSDSKDYTVAIGRVKEGFNVLAWLKNVDSKDIRIGMKLNLEAGKREDGLLTYFFTPAKARSR